MVLFGLVLLTMRQTLPALGNSGTTSSGIFDSTAGSTSLARVLSKRGLEDELADPQAPPEDPNIVQLGRIFAWICTVFYLSSRMPQLWKNFTRKSVQGLSILMFFWAAMGNLTYTLSILNSAQAVDPETGRDFLLKSVPYVLGSSGTLMFDVSIFIQWLYYTVDEEDPDVIEESSSAQQTPHTQEAVTLSGFPTFDEEMGLIDHQSQGQQNQISEAQHGHSSLL
ncbi:hypothetical protein FBU30_006549 [Linnemannia zychae]|nr:hypothetical protein FBU30_006549 [Linnemannia zychae]